VVDSVSSPWVCLLVLRLVVGVVVAGVAVAGGVVVAVATAAIAAAAPTPSVPSFSPDIMSLGKLAFHSVVNQAGLSFSQLCQPSASQATISSLNGYHS